MGNTILITGASSGIGKATAILFQKKGWNVIASMRTPEDETELAAMENVLVVRLDVTDSDSIEPAIAAGLERFGSIDALVNNAGYGAYGPLEAFDTAGIRRQFDTNVIGLLEVTKAVLPQMREQGSGTIVNISSIGGQITFPMGALYHGSKFAVEGLTESLHYELGAIGIKAKLVEPGMTQTDFGGRSFDFQNDESLAAYQPLVPKLFGGFRATVETGGISQPEVIAAVILEAVTDGRTQLRYTAGEDAATYLSERKRLDDETYISRTKEKFGL